MPCLLLFFLQISEIAKAVPELVHELGGWPPFMATLFLLLAAVVATAWAPVVAILYVMKSHERERAAIAKAEEQRREEQTEAAKERQETDARLRRETAAEQKEGLQSLARAVDHLARVSEGRGEQLAGMHGQLGLLAQQQSEANAKLGRVDAKTDTMLELQRHRRNGGAT